MITLEYYRTRVEDVIQETEKHYAAAKQSQIKSSTWLLPSCPPFTLPNPKLEPCMYVCR